MTDLERAIIAYYGYSEDQNNIDPDSGDAAAIERIVEALAAVQRGWLSDALAAARDQALEEAAKACIGSGAIVAEARLCASAIRALKGSPLVGSAASGGSHG